MIRAPRRRTKGTLVEGTCKARLPTPFPTGHPRGPGGAHGWALLHQKIVLLCARVDLATLAQGINHPIRRSMSIERLMSVRD
jgi:hypothetical protein